jgi:hypothetical protein
LPASFSGDIDAQVLRAGEIDMAHSILAPREGGAIMPKSVRARAGSGGATLSFTVGDGNIRFNSSLEN